MYEYLPANGDTSKVHGWHGSQNEAPRWTVELHTTHEAHVARIPTLRSLDGLSKPGWLGLICTTETACLNGDWLACWQQIMHFSASSQRQLLNPATHFPCSYRPQFDKCTAIQTRNLTQMLTSFFRSFFHLSNGAFCFHSMYSLS